MSFEPALRRVKSTRWAKPRNDFTAVTFVLTVAGRTARKDRESGARKYRTEIIARDLVMLGGNGNGDETRDQSQESAHRPGFGRQTNRGEEFDQSGGITDDDVPF